MAPVAPIRFGRRLPLAMFDVGCLLKICNDAFLGWTGIDLAQHRAPAAFARKLKDLGGGVAVGEDGVIAVSSALKFCECVVLKPLVSLADQLPTIFTRQRGFQFERQRREVWSSYTRAGEPGMKPASTPHPKIGDQFGE